VSTDLRNWLCREFFDQAAVVAEALHDLANLLVAERAYGRLLAALGDTFVDGLAGVARRCSRRRESN
jgi:hypothetical protein